MALFNNLAISENENVHKLGLGLLPSRKTFGVINSQSVKKKALQDVGNTLYQKSIDRANKPSGSIIKPQTKGKHLFREVKRTPGNPIKQEKKNHTLWLNDSIQNICDLKEETAEPVCQCDKCEEDYEDFMFKNINLTKKQIDDLALIWENPPTLGIDDIRKVDLNDLEIPQPEFLELELDSFLDHMPGSTDVPPFDLEMPESDGSFDFGVFL